MYGPTFLGVPVRWRSDMEQEQLSDQPEVIRCAGGCGEVVEEEGERCVTCADEAAEQAAGDDDYHRTREDEP